jgi:2-polyprenyl-3-methyl-5-hydroxy-6-metoxy-1,4-benzoquinol methylase
MLAPLMHVFADKAVADVGCGDLETMRLAPLRHYLGLDMSTAALDIARKKRPGWQFRQGSSADLEPASADLVVCLDVAIHQPTEASYYTLIDDLVAGAREAVVISGYQTGPANRGIVYFHEPLSVTLAKRPDVASVTVLGDYNGIEVVLAAKTAPAGANPHDIALPSLMQGVAVSPTPALLGKLAALSRDALGFFPRTTIRMIEYPWVAARLQAAVGLRILDVGAGISVVPLWLATIGARVVTVDGHPLIRDPLSNRSGWNEWGYLDYHALDPRIQSENCLVQALDTSDSFDVIYSVSVIEHMPAAARRNAVATCARLLVPGGRLLLTLDLVPGTEALWTLSEGVVVDPDTPHGTIGDFLQELADCGFHVAEQTLVRNIPDSRTDLLMLDARLAHPNGGQSA